MGAIEVDGLAKEFDGTTAVDHVSFEVGEGEIFGLLGPNGAGKTTTIRMLCTLLRPSEGVARVAGYDVVDKGGKVREHIGLVSEEMIMYDRLTAYFVALILFYELSADSTDFHFSGIGYLAFARRTNY